MARSKPAAQKPPEPLAKKNRQDNAAAKKLAAQELAMGRGYKAAAEVAGVELSTIWRWLQLPTFLQQVDTFRQGYLDNVERLAKRAGTQAALVLLDLMENGDCSVAKIMAANKVLELSGTLTPQQVFARELKLAELEVKREELQLKKLAANPVSNWAEVWAAELGPPARPAEFQQKALPAPQQEEE